MAARCCTVAAWRPRDSSEASTLAVLLCCKRMIFFGWACLDSNQGPLPYQGGHPFFAAYRQVRKSGSNKPFPLRRPRRQSAGYRKVSHRLASWLVSMWAAGGSLAPRAGLTRARLLCAGDRNCGIPGNRHAIRTAGPRKHDVARGQVGLRCLGGGCHGRGTKIFACFQKKVPKTVRKRGQTGY